jgi:hypothetical protein
MKTIKLTSNNVIEYIGYEIIFKTRGNHIIKRIISVSNTRKTIQIDHQDLENSLEIVSRNIYVILE